MLQGSEAAARQKDVHGAMARMCSQVSGEAVTEETVRLFRFRDWRKYAQVRFMYDTDQPAQLHVKGAGFRALAGRYGEASSLSIYMVMTCLPTAGVP